VTAATARADGARDRLVVACVQLCSDAPVADNLERAERHVRRAAARGAELIALPEKFQRTGTAEQLREAAEPADGPTATAVAGWARELGVAILAGSISERVPGDEKIRNLSLAFDAEGRCVAAYRKVHLFDVDLPGATYRESDSDRAGDELATAELCDWRVGLTICFDLRFPELYRALALDGAELLAVPSGFALQTGRDHWEVLLRARAIENACFVIAPDQHGLWAGKPTFGRSLIVDPWGTVVANAGDGEGICLAELDRARLREVRRAVPALASRRPDVYATAGHA